MKAAAVGIGGFFGAILRYVLGKWIVVENGFPFGTLVVNLAGCFILASFYTMITERWKVNQHVKLGLGTGVLGAFTTFSTFSVETLHLINTQQYLFAIIYVLLSVICGIGFALTGAGLARRYSLHKLNG